MPKNIRINDAIASDEWLKEVKNVYVSGGVIGFPTDTFYGLGVDPLDSSAIEKIFKIKSRDKNKPILLLIGEKEQLSSIVKEVSPIAETLMEFFWPGPLTLLFEAKESLPQSLLGNGNTVGVRFPKSELVLQLLRKIGSPITATSANISGKEDCRSGQELFATIGKQLDLVIDGGEAPGGKVSTIIDSTFFPPKLIREGALERAEIEAVLNISLD
jgi:L-threonylcarbamoyladenylate synthase